MNSTPNPIALVAALPSSFREVHGTRPAIRNHREMSAWLARMEAATLTAATNLLAVAEATGDAQAVAECGQYLAAHQAISALRAA